jgi:hypothetical protein
MALSPKSDGIISAQAGHCALHCSMQHAACNKLHKPDTAQLLSPDRPMCLALRRAHAVWHKPLPPPVGTWAAEGEVRNRRTAADSRASAATAPLRAAPAKCVTVPST